MTEPAASAADLRVRDAVMQEFDWDSQFDAADIGVSARNGAVTLTGSIDSYAAKLAAERAAKRVRGVRAIANDIQVRLRHERGDPEIAADVARELNLRPTLPLAVQAAVHGGHVTLTGTVCTLFQRAVADKAVHHVRGVKSIVNRIEVASGGPAADLQRQIARALARDTGVPKDGVEVEVSGNIVTLTGNVHSWLARQAAERAAMHAPGVTRVENRLTVIGLAEANNVENDIY
jgi:osmotically-inducible protein OsmY